MAGHTRELTWPTVSDLVNRKVAKLLQFINEGENEYQELLDLWTLHGNVDRGYRIVTDQLLHFFLRLVPRRFGPLQQFSSFGR